MSVTFQTKESRLVAQEEKITMSSRRMKVGDIGGEVTLDEVPFAKRAHNENDRNTYVDTHGTFLFAKRQGTRFAIKSSGFSYYRSTTLGEYVCLLKVTASIQTGLHVF